MSFIIACKRPLGSASYNGTSSESYGADQYVVEASKLDIKSIPINIMKQLFLSYLCFTIVTLYTSPLSAQIVRDADSIRIAELDRYWERLNKTVIEGDFEGNKDCFHEDAVIVFASGKNKISVPISTALAGWKEGFKMTREGKIKVNVECRFSQRIGNATTAHETGILVYTSTDNTSKISNKYIIPFEMLLVKRDDKWYGMMEHQKPLATQKEWDALI